MLIDKINFYSVFLMVLIISHSNTEHNEIKSTFTPIVLWHGMGDSCCFSFSLGAIMDKLNETLPGVHMLSLKIGDTLVNDVEHSYFLHPDKQIEIACRAIKSDQRLINGFNAIGFSQGSQFLRGLIQRCPAAKVKNFLSLGGQHQGVYGLPNCGSLSSVTCDYIRRLLNHAAYLSWVQKSLVQATYWHDPIHEEEYQKYSSFLANINNELVINEAYRVRLQALENIVFLKFDNDTMVEPVESEWFGFYKNGQSKEIESLQESVLYNKDRLGLRKMDEQGKLHFLSTPGNHLEFEWEWFREELVEKYLKN